jgi:transaldolase/glucose-6-phosphate isomerase
MNKTDKLTLEPGIYQSDFNRRLKQMEAQNFAKRFWNKDKDLWKDHYAVSFMGWIDVLDSMLDAVPAIEEFCHSKSISGFKYAVLLGMGGSSMAPLVFQQTFKDTNPNIKLIVLDTTDPKTIQKVENEIAIAKTLFIVSSKSGNTAEIMALYDYFFDRVYKIKEERAGENFIAITDQHSPLTGLAKRKQFRKVFINYSDIGGRFSALSYFGIVPAALMGINVREILERAKIMAQSCGPEKPIFENPGVTLGAAMAELAIHGCDKLTYLLPPELSSFGLWLEQLIAESTGKEGKGILPVNGNPLIELDTYGKDRFFVSMQFSSQQNNIQKLKELIALQYPVINILIKDKLDIGQEFFRWEIATAVAGAIMGINPFDQPNVQESKTKTNQLLKKVEQAGCLPEMEPIHIENTLQYYGTPQEKNMIGEKIDGKLLLENFFALAKAGNYIALQVYLPEEPEVEKYLLDIQINLQKSLHLPVTTQFGPRYLHSTGQYHKGGPNNGFFIQFVANSSEGIHIPGQSYTFGLLKRAQAVGDMQALIDHNRKVLLIDTGKDYINGLNTFKQVIKKMQPVKKPVYNRKPAFPNKEENSLSLAV